MAVPKKPLKGERVIGRGQPVQQIWEAAREVALEVPAPAPLPPTVVTEIFNRADRILNPPPTAVPFYTRRFMYLRSVRVTPIDSARLMLYTKQGRGGRTRLDFFASDDVRIAAVAEDAYRNLHVVMAWSEYDQSQSWYYACIDFNALVSTQAKSGEFQAVQHEQFNAGAIDAETMLALASQLHTDDFQTSRVFVPKLPQNARGLNRTRHHEYPGMEGYES